MKLLKSKKDIICEFLKDKDYLTVEEIALGCDLPKTKTVSTLFQLKYKNLVEKVDDKWKLLSSPPLVRDVEEHIEESLPALDNSESSAPQPSLPSEEPAQGITAKLDDIDKQLKYLSGLKEQKEKKAKLKKISLSKIKRYNKGKNRAVILMGNDQSMKLIKGEYFEGYKIIKVGKGYHPAGAIYTWLWENKQPCYLIHENSIEPLACSEIYAKAKEEGNLIDSQTATIQAAKMIEHETEEGNKKKLGMGMWIGIAIAGIVIVWLLFGGKK